MSDKTRGNKRHGRKSQETCKDGNPRSRWLCGPNDHPMNGSASHVKPHEQTALRRDNRFLHREYRKVLFPIMLSVLGGTINALIDSVFVSRRMGVPGLSAVNLSMPVYLVLCTLGSLVASGASVLSARAAGRERMEEAQKLFHTALTAALSIGLLSMVLGIVFLRPIVDFLAKGSSVGSEVEGYCRITFAGATVFVISYIPLQYLQLEGKTKSISRMIIFMVVIDILLDYILLYPLNMGLTGAALASVIAMLVSCAYGFTSLESGLSNYHFHLRSMNLSGCLEIVRYGSPAALGNLYDAAKLLAVNTLMLSVGGDSAVAVWAVLNTLSEFALVITNGVPRAGNAMLGVYHTARENSGIRTLVRMECLTAAGLSCLFAIAITALHRPIGILYCLDESLLVPLLCLGGSVLLNTLSCVLETCFNAAGRIALADVLVALRRLIFPVVSLIGLTALNGTPWLFLPLGGVFSLMACLLLTAIRAEISRRSSTPLSRILLLDDSLIRENKVLDFSIPADIDEACVAAEQISDFCSLNHMDTKQVIRLGLSIEELLNVIITKSPEIESVDLRVFAMDDMTGIRIRCAGKIYNPFQDRDSDDDFLMGIKMLQKMADEVFHTFTLGFNTISIIFRRNSNGRKNGPQ